MGLFDKKKKEEEEIVEEVVEKKQPTTNMTSKEYFEYHRDNFTNDERFKVLENDRKMESLNKFFDKYGTEYLSKSNVKDPQKIQGIKEKWVNDTYDRLTSTEKKKDFALPDFGKDLRQETTARQDVTGIETKTKPLLTDKEGLFVPYETPEIKQESEKIKSTASLLENKNNEAKAWLSSPEAKSLEPAERDVAYQEKFGDVENVKKEFLDKYSDYLDKANPVNEAKAETASTEEPGYFKSFFNKFAKGSARLGTGIARTPSFIYDIAAMPQNLFVDKVLGRKDLQVSSPEWLRDNPIATYYDKQVELLQKNTKQYDNTITGYIKAGEYDKALGLTGLEVSESLPLMIGLALGGVTGAPQSAMVGATALEVGAEKRKEVEDANVSEAAKTYNAIVTGLAEGAFESMGTVKIAALGKEIFKKAGKKEAQRVVKEGYKKTMENAMKRFYPVTGAVGEGLEESATTFTENLTDRWTGVDPNRNPMDGVGDSFIVGMVAGAGPTTIAKGAELLSKKDTKGPVGFKKEDIETKATEDNIPSYKIGDKTFETKEEFIGEVEKLKGQKETPPMEINNDEETANQVAEILTPKEETKPPKEEEKAKTPQQEEKAKIPDVDIENVDDVTIEGKEYTVVDREDGILLKQTDVPEAETEYKELTNDEFKQAIVDQKQLEKEAIKAEKEKPERFQPKKEEVTDAKESTQVREKAPEAGKVGAEQLGDMPSSTKQKEEVSKKEETVKAIKGKSITRVEGLQMGQNQAEGVYLSTEEKNRYETDKNKAEPYEVDIKNPIEFDQNKDDFNNFRNTLIETNKDNFEAIDFEDGQVKENFTIDDLSQQGINKLSKLVTGNLKEQGYDSIHFMGKGEGELVVFDKNKIKKKSDVLIQKHNALVSKLKEYNAIPRTHKTKRNRIRTEMDPSIKELGYSLDSKGSQLLINDKNGIPIKRTAIKTSKEEIEKHKALKEYPDDFQDFANKALINSEFLTGIDVPESLKQIQPAIKNIKEGKKTVGANNLLDFLEKSFSDGMVVFKKTQTTPAFSVTIQEFNNAIEEVNRTDEIPGDTFEEAWDGLLKKNEITEKEFNQLFNDYENQRDETGRAEASKEIPLADEAKGVVEAKESKEIAALRQKQSDLEESLQSVKKQKQTALSKAQERSGLFGDTKAEENQLFPETFEVTEATIENIKKPFDAKIATIKREIENIKKTIETGKKESQGQIGIADQMKDIASKIREGKINKPGELKMGTGFDLAWDGALEALATTLETTADIIKAIDAAINHIKESDWYRNLNDADKKQTDKIIKDHINDFYDTEKAILPTEARAKIGQAAERVKEHEMQAVKTKQDKAREAIFDNKQAYKNFQEEIVEDGGILNDKTDAYKAENLSHSRVLNKQENFDENKAQPLLNTIAKVIKKYKISENGVYYYLMSRHAPERNAYLAEKEIEKFRAEKEKEGLTEEEVEKRVARKRAKIEAKIESGEYAPAGISNPNARKDTELIESLVPKEELDKLHESVKNFTEEILKLQKDYGLISKQQYNEVKQMYDSYVPLRGWDKTAGTDFVYREASGEGVSSRTPITKGRTTLADNPIANLFNMVNSVIVEGEKNRIKQKAKAFISFNKALLKEKGVIETTYIVVEEIETTEDGKPTKAFKQIGEEYGSRSEIPQGMLENPDYKVVTQINTSTKSIPRDKAQQHQVLLYENGEPIRLQYEDPHVAMNLNNKDFNVNLEKAAAALNKYMSPFTRFVSQVYTSLAPSFIVPNTIRDFTLASMVHYVEGGVSQSAKFQKNFIMIQKALMKGPDPKSENKYQRMYADFKRLGAETGYVKLKSVDQFKKDIENDLKALQGNTWAKGKKGLKAVFKPIEKLANYSETLSRLATYVTAIEMGDTPTQAAYKAKNVTVNFNKKGRISAVLGPMYAFFNAGLQGVNLYSRMWNTNWKRMGVVHLTMMSTGFLSAMLADVFGGDDEEELMSDNISDYTKYNHFIIPVGEEDKYVKVPMPHIFRMWHGLGSMSYEVMKEMGRIDMMRLADKDEEERLRDKAITQRLSYFANSIPQDFLPMDIVGLLGKEGELNLTPIVPTALKPVVELIYNRNFMDQPIYKESFTRDLEKTDPNSQMYFKSVSPVLKDMTNWLFILGGGDAELGNKYKMTPGGPKRVKTDINPEWVEHLIQGYFGGTGKFVNNVAQTVYATISSDEEVDMDKIPIVSRFIGDANFDRNRNEFFQNKEKAFIWDKLYQDAINQNNREVLNQMKQHPHWIKVEMFNRYDEKIKKVRDFLKRPGVPEEVKVEMEKQIKLLTRQANIEMQ